MSRSNPTEIIPNPSTRWLEWQGSKGNLKYYDKEKKENVGIELPFEFILLDQLSTIKGWHDATEAGIFSNEVRDTRSEPFVVKSFKMRDPIAEGFYADIKDKVKANGGNFVTNLYIAYTNDEGNLSIGSLQFHGSALGGWMNFSTDKANRPELYKKGIRIVGSETGKKGGITFKVPKLEFLELSSDQDEIATDLDKELQSYLRSYFKRTRTEQADAPKSEEDRLNEELNQGRNVEQDVSQAPPDDDEIPF